MKLEPVYLLEPEPQPDPEPRVSRRAFAAGAVALFLGGVGTGAAVFGGRGESSARPDAEQEPDRKFSREWAREMAGRSDAALFEHAPAMILAASRWSEDDVIQHAVERLVSITLASPPSDRRRNVAMSLVAWFGRHPAKTASLHVQVDRLRQLTK